jgi:hypothetical protein
MTPTHAARMPEELTNQYLRLVDQALPHLVTGLYVVGSAALGAWQPGHSDVDTVIVTSRVVTPDDLAALADVHAALPARPHFDGVYLDQVTFAERPVDRRPVPFVVDGRLRVDRPCGELNPVLWLTLHRYGRAVRGPAVTSLAGVPSGPDDNGPFSVALRRYNLDNLRGYWQPLAGGIRGHVAGADPADPADAGTPAWTVLGPARLHYTLAHHDVVSKAGAGAYLADLFPRWASLAHRAVRWRAGEPELFTVADLAAAADAVDAVADDAWRRWG